MGRACRWLVFWAEYSALRAAIALLRVMPFDLVVWAGGAAWTLVAPHLRRHARADRHLAAMMPGLAAAERRAILAGMWRNLGQTFVESLLLDRLAARPERIEMDEACLTALRRTIAEGAITVTPHLGNWEAAVLPLAATGARHTAVYRAMKNPLVEAYLLRVRGRYYRGGLVAKGDEAARTLLRRARAGQSFGLMADLRDSSGFMVPFFGRLAPSTPFPAMAARQFGRPLFAVAVVRTGTARFRMVVRDVMVPRSGDRQADVREATAAIQAVFEAWIRQWPSQWMWAHRRYES